MAIGMYINNNVKIELGQIKEQITLDLSNNNIKYNIPFDKINSSGIKETLITMRNPDIEISLENDVVTYIKTENTEFSNLDTISDSDKIDIQNHLKNIKEKILEKIDTDTSNIKLERIDVETLNITLIIHDDDCKARVKILKDTFGDIYINSIRSI